MIRDSRTIADGREGRTRQDSETPEEPWGDCQILFVAHRTLGSTHSFFQGWRFEVVMGAGHPEAGATLLTVPFAASDLAASGWRYEMVRVETRPEPTCLDRTTFTWMATTASDFPDPLAAGLARAQDWLAAGSWQQDPADSSRYHKHQPIAGAARA